jgi:hypothetical protein
MKIFSSAWFEPTDISRASRGFLALALRALMTSRAHNGPVMVRVFGVINSLQWKIWISILIRSKQYCYAYIIKLTVHRIPTAKLMIKFKITQILTLKTWGWLR